MGWYFEEKEGGSLLAGRRADCQDVDIKTNFKQSCFAVQRVKVYARLVRHLGTLIIIGLVLLDYNVIVENC